MKLGIVSHFNERCGIADYSRRLIHEYREKDIDIVIASNYPSLNSPHYINDAEFFDIKSFFYGPYLKYSNAVDITSADINGMIHHFKDCAIVHIQFETALYHPLWFKEFVTKLRTPICHPKIVLTMHSSGMWPEFDMKLVDHVITHESMWCTNTVIPMGVKFNKQDIIYKNLLISFGLGRNNDDMVKEALKGNNHIQYETAYGNHHWLTTRELCNKIGSANAICLLYPPVGANVSSSAVMQALGSERPVIVTNTNWFSHIINYPGVYVIETIQDLKETIDYLFDSSGGNDERISQEMNLRKERLLQDGRDFDTYIEKHLHVYQNLYIKS